MSLIFLISVLFLVMAARSFNQMIELSLQIGLVRKRRRSRNGPEHLYNLIKVSVK